MKGLILTHQGKREEGLDLVKKGIRLDITSHIVWHVFGLIQKAEKNYDEALKSYSQALRFDKVSLFEYYFRMQTPDHLQILGKYEPSYRCRNPSNPPQAVRDPPGYERAHIAAAAHHKEELDSPRFRLLLEWQSYKCTDDLGELQGDGQGVFYFRLRSLALNRVQDVPDYDVEHSNITLFYVRVLEEGGEFSEAISVLDASAKSRDIVDRTSIMEYRGPSFF